MKKYGLIFLLSLFSLLLLNSCTKEMIKEIKVSEAPVVDYQIGDDLNNLKFKEGKLTIVYDSGREEVKNIDASWIKNFDFATRTLNLEYLNIKHDYIYEGFEHISSDEELIESASKSGIFIIDEGTYEVESLRYDSDIALIGAGNVVINVNSQVSSQASVLFTNNVTLANLRINSLYDNETLGVSCVKVAKIDSSDLGFIDRFYAKNVYFDGGKGLNIMACKQAKIDNSDIIVDPETRAVALSISSGSVVELNDTKVLNGTWGSIGIMGASSDSDKTWYFRKNELKVSNCDISSTVYIEYYETNNSTVTGLEGFTESTESGYKIYTKNPETL